MTDENEITDVQLQIDIPDFDVDLDMSVFDLSGFGDLDPEFEGNRYIKPKLYSHKVSNIKYDNAVTLAKELRLEPGDRANVIVAGGFIFGDFIEAYITHHNVKVNKMIISTLSLSQENVDSLYNLISGNYVDDLSLIISHYFYSNERNILVPYIYQELDKDNKFQLAVAGTHTKICIFETAGGRFIVIHGSANLRSSANIEQFTIEENEELYRFYEDYQEKIIDKYKTINKALRGKNLWHLINTKKL